MEERELSKKAAQESGGGVKASEFESVRAAKVAADNKLALYHSMTKAAQGTPPSILDALNAARDALISAGDENCGCLTSGAFREELAMIDAAIAYLDSSPPLPKEPPREPHPLGGWPPGNVA